jgi:hypothetical protein
MSNTDKLREFARLYKKFLYWDNSKVDETGYLEAVTDEDAIYADLTALISEGYVERAKYDEAVRQRDELREELIKYDEWVFENGKAFADTKESVDEYIEYLKNVKK